MTEKPRPPWAVRLEMEREAHGWSKPEMARQLLKAAGHGHGSIKSLARQVRGYENGEHFPRDWATAYATAFGLDEEKLFSGWADTARTPTMPFGHGLDPHPGDEDVKRRTLLGLLAAAATVPLARETEGLRVTLNEALISAPTDRDAAAWERVAFDYSHEVGAFPAAQLLPDLLVDFAEISILIATAQGNVRFGLVRTAAQLAALTAITLTNLSDPRAARRWWRTAGHAADECGDHLIAALVRGRQAVFSLYEARPSLSILHVAREAIEIGRSQPCSGVASGYAAKAQTLAQLSRNAEAIDALQDLERVFDQLPDRVSEDRRSQWGWSAQRLHHVTSQVHMFTGDMGRAAHAQDQALKLYPERNYQGRAQIELHRAGCQIRAGDIDEGARNAMQVLQRLPAEHAGDGLLRRTAMTSLGLAPSAAANRPTVREAYEQLALSGDQ